jgi:short-subunit dehydrogenase
VSIKSSVYTASKSVLICATGNIQQELNLEGQDGIGPFSLHSGGIKTAMNESSSTVSAQLVGGNIIVWP